MLIRVGIFMLLGWFVCGESARADFYLHHWENQRQRAKTLVLSPEIQWYQSTTNFDANGLAYQPSALTGASRMQTDLLTRYGILNRWSVYGRFGWARYEAAGTADSTNSTHLGLVYGLTDQTLGTTYRVIEGRVAVDLQAQVDFPLYSNNPLTLPSTGTGAVATPSAADLSTTIPFLGDGSIDFTGGGFVSWPFARTVSHAFSAVGGGGFTFRTAGFSAAMPYSLGFKIDPYKIGLKGSVTLMGFQSLKTDDLQSNAALTSCRGAGGSCLANAVNPTLLNGRATIGYQIDHRMNIALSVVKSLAGQEAPNGISFVSTFQIAWDFNNRSEYAKSNKGFVAYTFEAKVKRVSDRMNLVKIDKGRQDGIEEGQILDLFQSDKAGNSPTEAVARAVVAETEAGEASLRVTEYFKEVWIEEGFIAKRPIQ